MKKIIILPLIIFLFNSQLSAQTKDEYLLKSKHQKTLAWVLLGGGGALFAIGGIIGVHVVSNVLSGQFEKADNNVGPAVILDIVGGVSMLGSIPLFIIASKNKRQAMSMTFSSQQMPALVQHITGSTFIPSINLRIEL